MRKTFNGRNYVMLNMIKLKRHIWNAWLIYRLKEKFSLYYKSLGDSNIFLLNHFMQSDFQMCIRSYLINRENRRQLFRQWWMRPSEPKNSSVKGKRMTIQSQKIATDRDNIQYYHESGYLFKTNNVKLACF